MHGAVLPAPAFARIRLELGRLAARVPAGLVSLADQGVVSGFGFLSGIAAARLLGIAEFGSFALVLIVLSFAQGLHNALITAPMMTLSGTRGRVSGTYAASVLAGAVLLSLPGAAFVVVALSLSGEPSIPGLVAATALMLAQNIQFTLRRLLFARGEGMLALGMDLARAASFPLAGGLVWLEHGAMDGVGYVWLLAATSLATTLPFVIGFARPAIRSPRRLHVVALTRRHMPIARWLLPIVFVTFAQEQFVWIAAGSALGLDALGGLRAAQYLVGTVLLLLAATENVLPVAAARAYAAGGEAALKRSLLRAGLRLGLPIGAILLVLAGPAGFWLGLIFGQDYAAYAHCLQILSLGVVLVLLRDLTAHYFRAKQNTRVIFLSLAVSMGVSLALVWPLITYAGVTGAASAVIAGHAASLLSLVAAMRRGGGAA
ncbi:lipopolysaccharide biosynthesis protein [Methylobacterium sp. ID0610]|uniref:lipopolysaccharide biosynthesis protein n=1 Tax=Methylobacterium carpenticola TaxID=3344827 RepID=UPI0036BA9DC1